MNKLVRTLNSSRILQLAASSKLMRQSCSHDSDGANNNQKKLHYKWYSHDQNVPFIHVSERRSDIDIYKLTEKPFLFFNKKRKKQSKHGKKRKMMINEDYNVELPSCQEAPIDKQHPTIRLALNLINSASNKNEQSNKQSKQIWRYKSPVDILNNNFLKNNAHLLGLSEMELSKRYEFLMKLGLNKMESLSAALSFPSSLNLESKNIEELAKLFMCYKIDVMKLLIMHPFVFGLSYEEVSKKLDHLGSVGLRKREVADLVSSNPLILCFSLSECAKEALKSIMGVSGLQISSGKSQFIGTLLKTSLQEKSVKYEFNAKFESATLFLEQLELPVSDVFKSCPEFFSTELDCLYRIMHYLIEQPFFFDIEALKIFIHKYPDLYLQLDKEEIRQKIDQVFQILGEGSELYQIMQATPKMFILSKCLESRIRLFLDWNFTKKHVLFLMKKFPLFFYDNRVVENLKERMEFLLKEQDLSVNEIMKFPFCLQMRLAILTCKIGYVRQCKPEALKTTSLQKLFTVQDEEFAVQICSKTLEDFYAYIESNFPSAESNWIKKKGRPQKRKNITEAFS